MESPESPASWRALAGGGESDKIDYTVFSVAFWTLMLLFVADILRHNLDHASSSRPFFHTVLQGVYRELSVVGIVEAVIFHLHIYLKSFDVGIEVVFARVHFFFFYTAIVNALQTILVGIVAASISHKMWVEAEEVNIAHYISIREEFDQLEPMFRKNKKDGDEQDHFTDTLPLTNLLFSIKMTILHPILYPKYHRLLVIVRFHELKVHFLDAFDLPASFKISRYLKRSELHVFKKMSHIPITAWFLVMAIVNLLYYFMGIIQIPGTDQQIVGKTLSGIFVVCCQLFLVLSFGILNHMNHIFSVIMHKSWKPEKAGNDKSFQRDYVDGKREGSIIAVAAPQVNNQQNVLFWTGNPHFVFSLVQMLQIGCAIALSILLLYWPEFSSKYAPMNFTVVVAIFAVCYLLSLSFIAQILPLYTLCTSLGGLVNQHRLNETLALFRLDEAVRRREMQFEEAQTGRFSGPPSPLTDACTQASDSLDSVDDRLENIQRQHSFSNDAPSAPSANQSKIVETVKAGEVEMEVGPKKNDEKQSAVEKNGQKNSPRRRRRLKKSLSDISGMGASAKQIDHAFRDDDKEQDRLKTLAQSAVQSRRLLPRQRSISDGVAEMAATTRVKISAEKENFAVSDYEKEQERMKTLAQFAVRNTTELPNARIRPRRERRRLGRTLSDGVAAMAALSQAPSKAAETIKEVARTQTGTKNNDEKQAETKDGEEKPKRRRLKKSLSDISGMKLMVGQMNLLKKTNGEVGHLTQLDKTPPADAINDIYDVPDADSVYKSRKLKRMTTKVDFLARVKTLVLSKLFSQADFTFGTMPCFFFVGMRVEYLLAHTHTILYSANTLVMDSQTSFYFEMAWLTFFILKSIFLIILFFPKKSRNLRILVSSVSDGVLSSICLSLLLLAEMQRCCDKHFGGGYNLGKVEPFTALIFLRIFRFAFSERVHGYIVGNHEDDHGQSNSGHGHENQNKTGTAVELWRNAITEHPDIVSKYGEFSSELLQTMLGIKVIKDNSRLASTSGGFKNSRRESKALDAPPPTVSTKVGPSPLPAQGHPHNSMLNENNGPGGGEFGSHTTGRSQSIRFEDMSYSFAAPQAVLIRQMRRCEKRLPPFLDAWHVADAVLTKYEIIFFDPAPVDGNDDEKRRVVRDAMSASKGGKGLTLREVAIGRKVISRIELCNISAVTVEKNVHRMSRCIREECEDEDEDGDVEGGCESRGLSEYWSGGYADNLSDLSSRWDNVEEDDVKIHTSHGILSFRFFHDLIEAEMHPQELEHTDIKKNDAFLWCQTIVRICGPDQLSQDLPHYGDADDEELADYLEIVDDDRKRFSRNGRMSILGVDRKIFRRNTMMTTFGDDRKLLNPNSRKRFSVSKMSFLHH